MKEYTLNQLFQSGVINDKLRRALLSLACNNSTDLCNLAKDTAKVHRQKCLKRLERELFNAASIIPNLETLVPEMEGREVSHRNENVKQQNNGFKFRIGDFTEDLLKQSDKPIKLDIIVEKIKNHIPNTYYESVRVNLSSDKKKRFVLFIGGFVGLKEIDYGSLYIIWNRSNKRKQYAEERIMEFLSFIEDKHRSPQPHGLDEEESLYRWYLDFIKDTSDELKDLRDTFNNMISEYDKWCFTPVEYSYKRNCDQLKWFVDEYVELPSSDEESELATWFNSQLENYKKYKDKRKSMFEDLLSYLEDYGLHFYDINASKGKTVHIEESLLKEGIYGNETTLEKYQRALKSMHTLSKYDKRTPDKALLLLAIIRMAMNGMLASNIIVLNNDLLMGYVDVCMDYIGTASSCDISIPFWYMYIFRSIPVQHSGGAVSTQKR